MTGFRSIGRMAGLLALALAGCGNAGHTNGASGEGSARLTLDINGVNVDRVEYTISGAGFTDIVGTLPVVDGRDPPVWALIAHIPAGPSRTITLRAYDLSGHVLCEGSAVVDVLDGQTVKVTVALDCGTTPEGPRGDVEVDGELHVGPQNLCPVLHSTFVGPEQVAAGGTADVEVVAGDAAPGDPEGGALTYAWTATSGSFADPSAHATQYTCDASGVQTLTVVISDGDTSCDQTVTIDVACGGVVLCAGVCNGAAAVALIAASDEHSLALEDDGTLWNWGDNRYGQVGDGTTTDRNVPVQVSGLTRVTALAAGDDHSLAIEGDGTVWAWGWNLYGQLGDGTTTDRNVPVQVSGLTHVIALAAGHGHSLALEADGTVWAWGDNGAGQLGDGTRTDRHLPVQVSRLTGVTALAAGSYHSLALEADGTVWAWGDNGAGQLGDGTHTDRNAPVQVSGLTGVIALAAGRGHSLALTDDGTVWAWGYNSSGQLGDGTHTDRNAPVQVSGLTHVAAVAAGDGHSLALEDDGTVWGWGRNGDGELGDGTNTDRSVPVQVTGL